MAEARRLEESGDVQEAIVVYRQALAVQEETTGFVDLSLYNGLGDLYLRSGELGEATEALEEAAQHCEDEQLYSNGIAVCKKILRNAPDYVHAYRRLGRLQALSGLEAQSLSNYRTYCEHMEREGRPDDVMEALWEFVELTADDATALELADTLVETDQGLEALTRLRAVRDKREEEGRDVVALVRRIQELQPRYGEPREASPPAPAAPRAETAGPSHAAATDRAESEAHRDTVRPTRSHDSDSEVATLMHELQDVLSRLDGKERFRHALPIVEQLLQLEPDQFGLLHRKLGYAYALGEETATIEAYLALGECLDRHLSSFSVRALSTSTPSGSVKMALQVEGRPEMGPTT